VNPAVPMPDGSGLARRLRDALLAAAAALIDLVDGKPDLPAVPVRVRVERNGCKLSYETGSSHVTPAGPDPFPTHELLASAFFCDLERRAVRTLDRGPLQAKEIGRKLGMDHPTTQLKTALAVLVERGVLRNTRDGYEVTSPVFLSLAADGAFPT
jgi:hypothetical protein